jgi:hypothetical protein
LGEEVSLILVSEKMENEAGFYLTGQVVAAYIQVRLTRQDCLPDRQVKRTAGALHLGIFEEREKNDFFSIC